MVLPRFSSRRKGGSSTALTSHHISELLPKFLEEMGGMYHGRPDLVLAAWPEVIGASLAPMTQAVSFVDGVLVVKVRNSTLYSLLVQNERGRLMKSLREKFPKTEIKTLHFRLG